MIRLLKKVIIEKLLSKISRIDNPFFTKRLLEHLSADEKGHEANAEKGDLGYGWMHYGFIRYIKPKRVLCIGSRYGFVPGLLAQACKDNGFGRVDFVDAGYDETHPNNWTGKGFWKKPEGRKVFKFSYLEKHIQMFVMTSQAFAKKYQHLRYDFIYIDGDHSYKGVKRDYDLFWPALNKGGLMVFHDITVKETFAEGKYGVHKLWKKIASSNAIQFHYSGSGIGILQKK